MKMSSIDLNRPTCKCEAKRCVLVVDDDPQTSQDHAQDLRDWGYEPVVAEGQGMKLLEDARAKARRHRCRVAIVDMRLFDADGDESGLALAGQLAPTVCVIVTAYGTLASTNRSRRYDNIASFFEKGDDPDGLIGEVHNAFEKFCPCSLEVEGPGYDELLRRILRDSPEARPDEIRCALECLYRDENPRPDENLHPDENPKIEKLHLVVPDAPYPLQTTATAPARSAVYIAEPIRADRRPCQREVVKVAERQKIEREAENYKRRIKPFVPAGRCARIEDRGHSVVLWNIGAIRYTNIARDNRQLFRAWYAHASSEQVTRALEDLFSATLGPLYKERDGADSQSVYDYYIAHMFKSDFESRIHGYCADHPDKLNAATLLGAALMLRDPVWWALKHRGQSSFRSRWEALTHGDLHSGNIFVDEHCETYVLDYERSGPGYILRDFAELEADIRLRLAPIAPEQLRLLYALDLALLAPTRGSTEPQPPIWRRMRGLDSDAACELQKAFEAICVLRRLARELTGELDQMNQYYWALLMETLISVLRNYSDVEASAKAAAINRARLSAALIAERLAAWNSDWPPRGWPRPEDLPERSEPPTVVEPDEE
ncbi:MAG: phosphotransferase [Anaerolineae bacterium]|nr:phosphotransferase [Anaerolineae bacterium]